MTKATIRLLLVTLIMSVTLSCADEGVDGPVGIPLWDIVTFEGNIDGHANFSFRQVNDTPLITLVADRAIPADDLEGGERMYISYLPESNTSYTSGPVTLYSAAIINQAPMETAPIIDLPDWNRDPVYVYSAWRSGTYINLHVRLTYDREPRTFCLVADEATISSPTPDIYLVHTMAQPSDYHDRVYYASFDISDIWERPDVTGVRLHIANSNLDKGIFTFNKKY